VSNNSEVSLKHFCFHSVCFNFKYTLYDFYINSTYAYLYLSRHSSVGIATAYGVDDWMIGIRFSAGAGNFTLRHRVQTGSGAHPASYPMDTGLFPWGLSGRGVKLTIHLNLMSMSKNAWSYTYTPQYVFMSRYLVKHRDYFTFTFYLYSHVVLVKFLSIDLCVLFQHLNDNYEISLFHLFQVHKCFTIIRA
jgi:hypothetical protein